MFCALLQQPFVSLVSHDRRRLSLCLNQFFFNRESNETICQEIRIRQGPVVAPDQLWSFPGDLPKSFC